jgi:hypothetical protein
MLSRRSVLAGAACLPLAAPLLSRRARAQQDITFFRILTGGTVGTYFPIGGLIANAISNPPGSRPCNEGGSCGVPGLVATSVASNGSVANVAAIAAGTAQSGFVQSDIAYWAYNGTGIYQGRPKVDGLRAIANLYPESIQLVVRKGSGIKSVPDLRGRKVSLDEPGLGHPGRRTADPIRLWREREGPQGRVLPRPAGRRQPEGRDDRRLLQRQRLAAERRGRPRRHGRHRAGADRRAPRSTALSRSSPSSAPTRFPTTPTRASPA